MVVARCEGKIPGWFVNADAADDARPWLIENWDVNCGPCWRGELNAEGCWFGAESGAVWNGVKKLLFKGDTADGGADVNCCCGIEL